MITEVSYIYILVQTARGPRRSTKFALSGTFNMKYLTAQRTQETRHKGMVERVYQPLQVITPPRL